MKKRRVREDEAALWQAVTRDVAPLPSASRDKAHARPSKSGRAGVVSRSEPVPAPSPPLRPPARPAEARAGDVKIGTRSAGLDRAHWKRFTHGKVRIDARIDLHGYFVHEAFERLHGFLHKAHRQNWRCVEVVTGRGSGQNSGMIRRELPLWLQRGDLRPMILAVTHPYASAARRRENHGAVLILLRKNGG